jgi:hypothetical protein
MSAHGHVWGNFDDRDLYNDRRRVTPHLVAGDDVIALAPLVMRMSACSRCGLVGAREDRRDGVSAYGLDLDSLAVMRSAPRCDGERDASAGT